MLRIFRPRNSILSTARLPLRLEAKRQSGQLQNVQRVRFQKPGIRWKPFLITGLAIYVSFSVYQKLVLDPLLHTLEDGEELDLPDPPESEEEEKPLFIPFPGTTKELKPVPYRGSDPEWQAFIKFSKDQELAQRVRDELANFVRIVASKHPMLVSRCGKNMKLRRYWLDVDFPTHPPPEFERTGVEITDEFIAISTMPVDSLTVFRIRNALWPAPLAKSFWSFTTVLVKDDIKKVANFFGIQTGTPVTSMEQILAKHAELTRGLPPTKRDPKDGPPPLPPSMQNSNKAMIPRQAEEKTIDGEGKGIPVPLQAHFSKAILAFKMKLQQTWKPAPNYPPRGSILVTGFVEVDSPKAWLVFDVKAAWDPKTKSYDARSMQLSLRRMQMKKQGPLGGA